MSVQEIGKQLCDFCRQGKNMDAINTLYAPTVVSVEAAAMGEMPRIAEGIDAVRGKNQWWSENHEVHSATVKGPFAHGEDRFAVIFDYDVTQKGSGQRHAMEEVAVYTVTGGKIAREEFFYSM